MRLLIVESSGKIKPMRLSLSSVGCYDVDVIATNGRLFDLPDDRLGVNKETGEVTEKVASNQYTLEFIKKKLAQCKSAFIATDNDSEGDSIALDVYEIAEDKSKVKRAILSSISGSDILQSIDLAVDVDPRKAEPGIAKRVFDRVIGFEMSGNNWENYSQQGTIGRVITPTLSVLSKSEYNTAVAGREIISSGNKKWTIKAELTNKSVQNLEGLAFSLDCIEDNIDIEDDGIVPREKASLTGPSSMIYVAKSLNMPMSEVSSVMQSMYEKGVLSYIRTDCSSLSEKAIFDLREMISDSDGVIIDKDELTKVIDDACYIESQSYQEAAHDGLVPLKLNCRVSSDFRNIGVEDQISVLLTKKIIELSGVNQVEIRKGKASSSQSQAILRKIELDYGVKISIEQYHQIHGHRRTPVDIIFNTNGLDTADETMGKTKYKRYPKDLVVASVMHENKLGRPSTISYHASKIANEFTDSGCRLNHRGMSSISRAKSLAPLLLEPENALAVERILSSKEPNSVFHRLNSAAEAINVSFTKKQSDSNGITPQENSKTKDSQRNNLGKLEF